MGAEGACAHCIGCCDIPLNLHAPRGLLAVYDKKASEMIDETTREKIKDAANVVDVLGDFIELRRKGRQYEALCPFHNDHHLGSFVVDPVRNIYKCFSCDAGGDAVQFLMDYQKMTYPDALRYLATKYGIAMTDDYDREKFRALVPVKPKPLHVRPNNLTPRLWPIEWVKRYREGLESDNLVRWLAGLPWEDYKRNRLRKVLKNYCVGHSSFIFKGERHEFTLFWQVDQLARVHNAHFMKYRTDGHRDKDSSYSQTWLHARMRYAKQNPFDDNLQRASYCLFGEHLLSLYPGATARIVESEKTALFMATAYGNNDREVWLACGGLQNINQDRLAPLIAQGRKIELFPDRDGVKAWKDKAMELRYKRVAVNDTAVTKWWHPEDGDKADIADVILGSMLRNSGKPAKQVGEVLKEWREQNPAFARMQDSLGLIPTNNK